jgi:small-conductance mechanosensitive channel
MNDLVQKWIHDPMVGRIALVVLGVLLIQVLMRFLRTSLGRYVHSSDARYRMRKFLSFGGYLVMLLFIAAVFSDKLGGLNVAFGIAGAGIAFSLQEVIASTAGWVAITFGNFFSSGDRVQLGGIMGDVIDIGILRTTLMECGEWVKGDQYN